jgi:hypothetical protein
MNGLASILVFYVDPKAVKENNVTLGMWKLSSGL